MLHGLVLALILFGAFASLFVSKSFPFERHDVGPIVGLSLPSVGASRIDEPVLAPDVLPDTVRREEVGEALLALAGEPVAESEAAAAGASAAASAEEPVAAAVQYRLYTVKVGDSASAISALFGVDLQYLLWANPDLRDGELLTVGQMLVVPGGNGLLVDVRYGDTLSVIAERFSVTVDDIIGWSGNGIVSADQLVENQALFLPGGVPPVTILPEPSTLPADEGVAVTAPPPVPVPAPPAATGPVSGLGLMWPVAGPISSYYDYSHPLGIDIDMFSNPWAPVGAATSGTVTFAGGDPCCSYGLYVVVVSAEGVETLYSHFSSIAVSVGQQVSQGATLGNVGCTGYCTGNHLHFEVIDNGIRVNPLAYLP